MNKSNSINLILRRILILSVSFLVLQINVFGTESETVKIACNENYYPYIIKNETTGQLEGVIIDWWKLWAEKNGIEIELVPLDMETSINQAVSGEIDAIAGLFYSKERGKKLDFTDPLLRMKTVLFLQKGLQPDSVAAISEKIGVLKNDLAYDFLSEKYPGLDLVEFDRIDDLRNEILDRSIAGYVYDIPDPIKDYKPPKVPKGYYAFETLYAEGLRTAVKSGNRKMWDLIVAGSAKISNEELEVMAEKYQFFQPNRRLLWILLITGIVLGTVIALLIDNFFRNKRKLKMLEDYAAKTDWQMIIDKGENDHIEFKSSLRYDYRLEKANKVLEKVITKTISAFLNTEGGMLFIGVDDDGNVLGLDNDYNCLGKKNRDGFLLSLTNVINVHLGKSVHKYIHINIISINDRDVCIITVEECDKPVFMGKNDNEEFYIRASASSQPLGVRETYKYINSHWKK